MSSLLDLASAVADILYGAGDAARSRSFIRAVDIEPFIEAIEMAVRREGGERCGDDRLCLDAAVLVYEPQPLLSPDRRGSAEHTRRQLDDVEGLTLTRIERPHEHVLALSGSVDDGWVDVRIVAHRGWIFVVGATDEPTAAHLTSILDAEIAATERSSGR